MLCMAGGLQMLEKMGTSIMVLVKIYLRCW